MPSLTLDRLGRHWRPVLRALLAAADRRSDPVIVGGAVRDACLGRPRAPDLDVAIGSGAIPLARRLADRVGGAFVSLDAERGVARVLVGGVRVDIADFRAATLDADLRARDFTVNALALSVRALLREGRAPIVDPMGGLADLRARRLRLASTAALGDDPLRALRAVRLEHLLGFRLASAAARAITGAAPQLGRVSAERVRDELLLLLALRQAARAMRRADQLRLLATVVPEIEAMRATQQPPPHRFTVLEHSLRAVAGSDLVVARAHALAPFGEELAAHLTAPLGGGVTRGQVLKLAALLHDVSKPETYRVRDGRVTFFEHDERGAARARAIGERLRLPGEAVAALERLVRYHLRPMHLGGAGEITDRARWRFYRDLGADTRDLLLLALVDAAAVRGQSPFAVWRRATLIRDLLRGWAVQRRAAAAPPLLRGDDVMARFGLAPGPEVGRLLARAREAQDLGLVRTRDAALAYLDSSRAGP
jgi:putative nucleotidyltransferase with HDIG domain